MNTFENVLAQRETVSQCAVAAGKRQASHGRIRVKAAEAVASPRTTEMKPAAPDVAGMTWSSVHDEP